MITSEREARSEFLLITSEAEGRASSTENKGKSWVWAARRPWSRFWEAYISGTESPIDKRSSLMGIPSTVYGTNAESCKYPLWDVARGARGMSKIFRLLFSAQRAEILYAIGVPLVTAYAVVTGGISLHVRTYRDTPHTALLYLGNGLTDCVQIWYVGWGSSTRCLPQVICGVHLHVRTCAPLSHKCPACRHSVTVGPIALKFGKHLETH